MVGGEMEHIILVYGTKHKFNTCWPVKQSSRTMWMEEFHFKITLIFSDHVDGGISLQNHPVPH
uniref:Uncharacterized protein n=1 Tax=Lepeophtheirus salmonis TaxID=72036 RepID=A0A0K2TWI3_LEPSM